MNWGYRLLIVFIAFGTMIGILVYKSVTMQYDLVSEDYYQQELKYQDKIDGVKNANAITGISVIQDNDAVTIMLPPEHRGSSITGEVWFYCTTDANKDRHFNLNVDNNGAYVISKEQLVKGNMQLKLTWKYGEKGYYTEKEIFIN